MKWLLENPVTSEANVGRPFGTPGLSPLLQEYHFGTIYGIRLSNKQHPINAIRGLTRRPSCPEPAYPKPIYPKPVPLSFLYYCVVYIYNFLLRLRSK